MMIIMMMVVVDRWIDISRSTAIPHVVTAPTPFHNCTKLQLSDVDNDSNNDNDGEENFAANEVLPLILRECDHVLRYIFKEAKTQRRFISFNNFKNIRCKF